MHFTPLTHNCALNYSINLFIKLADDTTAAELINNKDQKDHRREVKQLTMWCSENNFSLNVKKRKKKIDINFWRAHTQQHHLWSTVLLLKEWVAPDFWVCTSRPLLDKQQHHWLRKQSRQHPYFFRILRRPRVLRPMMCRGTESILTSCITVLFGNPTTSDHKPFNTHL